MSSITEERQKILKKKLKEMGNYGVQVRTPEESPFYDQPTDYERELERMQVDEPEEEESHVQLLKDVLRDVRAKTTITSYIENILLEHLKEHQALLNKTAAQYKRNQTLNL